jgi:DNA-binding transcriptional MerR regulator
MAQDDPIYNIGVVERMTDIPAATLRVWERRYDFPDTSRTEGGHRLYSERSVQQLKWVKAKIDAGMQTRQAVKALRAIEEEEGFGFAAMPGLGGEDALPSLTRPGQEVGDSYLALLQQRLFDTLIEHNTLKADDVFDEALGLYSAEDVMMHLIRPTLTDIGDGWAEGEVSVGTEHLATGYLRQRLLTWLRSGPPAFSVPETVLACAPEEYHEGSLMIVGALLRRRRWPVAYLGQSIPLPELARFVRETSPLAVVLVAMTEESVVSLAEWPKWLPEAAEKRRPVIAYGGRIFNESPEWRAQVPGLFMGATITEGVETLERTLRTLVPVLA